MHSIEILDVHRNNKVSEWNERRNVNKADGLMYISPWSCMPPIVLQHFYDRSSLQHAVLFLYPKDYKRKADEILFANPHWNTDANCGKTHNKNRKAADIVLF